MLSHHIWHQADNKTATNGQSNTPAHILQEKFPRAAQMLQVSSTALRTSRVSDLKRFCPSSRAGPSTAAGTWDNSSALSTAPRLSTAAGSWDTAVPFPAGNTPSREGSWQLPRRDVEGVSLPQ